MSGYSNEQKRRDLERWLATERTELGKEIKKGNYKRAAGIANFISQQLMRHLELVEGKSA